ncbi:hypothetical protein OJAV_G00106090 [Oryzias javanicus]|uniref:PID domain-containing protein n=1 Tax=Oryzias javanicus TaxID=123683 RepID=A0A3S2P7C2_ORYJA|nr:hypothetical protein OJAV_G00106090 [Oryzias javanicus]
MFLPLKRSESRLFSRSGISDSPGRHHRSSRGISGPFNSRAPTPLLKPRHGSPEGGGQGADPESQCGQAVVERRQTQKASRELDRHTGDHLGGDATYLPPGMTLLDQPKGEELSASAVKRIVATAKAVGQEVPQASTYTYTPLQRLVYCSSGIVLYDRPTNQLLENVSIYRISYCTVDKLHDKVFAYITQNALNGTLECHAYLCAKRREAQAVALTVAQAFTVAFELWQVAREEKGRRVASGSAGDVSSSSERSNSVGSLRGAEVATEKLLELGDGGNTRAQRKVDQNHSPPDTLNNLTLETEDGLDEAFSSCALDSYASLPDLQCRVLTLRSWTMG